MKQTVVSVTQAPIAPGLRRAWRRIFELAALVDQRRTERLQREADAEKGAAVTPPA